MSLEQDIRSHRRRQIYMLKSYAVTAQTCRRLLVVIRGKMNRFFFFLPVGQES